MGLQWLLLEYKHNAVLTKAAVGLLTAPAILLHIITKSLEFGFERVCCFCLKIKGEIGFAEGRCDLGQVREVAAV